MQIFVFEDVSQWVFLVHYRSLYNNSRYHYFHIAIITIIYMSGMSCQCLIDTIIKYLIY